MKGCKPSILGIIALQDLPEKSTLVISQVIIKTIVLCLVLNEPMHQLILNLFFHFLKIKLMIILSANITKRKKIFGY